MSTTDLRAAAQLAVRAVVGATDVVEAAHATIASPAGRPRRARGIAGLVYRIVRFVTRAVGRALDAPLAVAERELPGRDGTPARDAVVAALNGAFGDSLDGSALATPMHLRHDGQPLDLDRLADADRQSDALLVQVHGICMHDGQWGTEGHDPGAVWAEGVGATRLALRYNSGRHISTNGRELAGLLCRVMQEWPVPVRRVVLVGHSMGGLVLRAALAVAEEEGHEWLGRDVTLVTLGTPHHGAPLERVGNAVDAMLGATRWSAPYARVGQIRSPGVTDLRFGSVHDDDWTGLDRFERLPDRRRAVPLPPGVSFYAVAATTGETASAFDQTWGDGLVPLDSALGRHGDPARDLGVHPDRHCVARGTSHFDLLWRPEVTAQVLGWLRASARTALRNER